MNRRYVLWEAILCFLLPAYQLLWGVLAAPLLLAVVSRSDATYALIHLLCTVGGCLGMAALVMTLRYVLVPKVARVPWSFIWPATIAGLVSLWTTMTGQFAGFDLGWFSILTMIVPTLCTAHIMWLARQKSRGSYGFSTADNRSS